MYENQNGQFRKQPGTYSEGEKENTIKDLFEMIAQNNPYVVPSFNYLVKEKKIVDDLWLPTL